MTKIEQLDQHYAGLAIQVRTWFDQGFSARAVSNLLRERYQVVVAENTVGNFRTQRWARERKVQEAKEIEAKVAAEHQLLLEMKRTAGANFAGVGK